MKTLSQEYLVLFNEITDASETLTKLSNELSKVTRRLMSAQMCAEELFIKDDSTVISSEEKD